MKVLVTGLPCNKKSSYLKAVKDLAKKNKKDIQIYSVGDILFKAAKESHIHINPKNILNMPDDKLTPLVQNAYSKIEKDMKNHENIIINTHAIFYWKNIWRDSNNSLFLQNINPDLFITMIDAPGVIQKNMNANKQWKTQNLSLQNVLDWQNWELLVTNKYWANVNRKDFLALPRNQPAESLYKLMFCPDIESVYSAFPMTNLNNPEESYKKIDEFIQRLREYFVVIDPRTIELKLEHATEAESNQTVYRDLELFVGKTDKTVCYYPEIVHSSGAMSETMRAHETTKDVYHILDKEKRSPFTDFNAEVFLNLDDFFQMLEKEGYIKIKIKR